jgi:DNA-binding beta-propeller fold protein YncE
MFSNAVKAIVVISVLALLVATWRLSSSAAGPDDGEVWVTSQGTDRLFIISGLGSQVEEVALPAGTGPHITTFSPSGKYAYMSGMASGDLLILRAGDREIVEVLDFGPALVHQAKPSPDGSLLLVAQIAGNLVHKVGVNEDTESWSEVASLALPSAPVCTVFRDDGQLAFVSLRPSGIAVLDIPSMTLVGTLPTDGFVACGMVKSHDGKTITVASSGAGGHIYRLDTTATALADMLTDAGTLGAADWHSFAISPNEATGFGSSPGSDEVVLVDLAGPIASKEGTMALSPVAGIGNDEPDAMAVRGNTLFVTLRESGKLAIVQVNQGSVDYLDLAAPFADFNPVTCAGCALHGVTVRP